VRRSLAGISAAVTSLVAVAFLVPLWALVAGTVQERAVSDAYRNASAIAPVLALTTDTGEVNRAMAGIPAGEGNRMTVYLPGWTPGSQDRVVGVPRAPAGTVGTTQQDGRSRTVGVGNALVVLQPVLLRAQRIAVVEVLVREQDLSRGVERSRAVLLGVALILVAGSVAVSDRLASRVVRSTRKLGEAATRLGSGELDIRIRPQGPAELQETAVAFNTMAARMTRMVAAERELAADLSHRLRTPMAGLVLACRGLGNGPQADQLRALAANLEEEIDTIIREARSARKTQDAACDAVAVLRERLDFWGALAEDQGRAWRLSVPPGPVTLPTTAQDLSAVADALLGNIFLHTPEGTGFQVVLSPLPDGVVRLAVEDAGPGIADPRQALTRGNSSAGSTGLGLDIARSLAERCNGQVTLTRSRTLGGAAVVLTLRLSPAT
jgi:signal transduction histidine kinase